MIKFFRKIRQQMIKENRVSKYLLYAIGEIVLVVIGILIALSINNSNQEKSERRIEQDYIFSLIEDAKTDISNFEIAITSNEYRVKYLDSLEYMCYNYSFKEKKDPKLTMRYMGVLRHPDFIRQTDRTLSQLKNSGGMRLIEDKNIIDAIISYEESFEKLYNQQVWYEGALKDLVDAGIPIFNYKYLSPKPNLKLDRETFNKTARLLETDKRSIIELGNRASIYNAITGLYLIYLEAGKQECLNLIDILENKNTTMLMNTESGSLRSLNYQSSFLAYFLPAVEKNKVQAEALIELLTEKQMEKP